MNTTEKIEICKYDYFNKCFAGEGVGPYEIGYLFNLLDEASDWNEKVLGDYTASDVLANLVYDLGIGTKCGEALDDIFEAVKKAVE